jgi:hypothetical protein
VEGQQEGARNADRTELTLIEQQIGVSFFLGFLCEL